MARCSRAVGWREKQRCLLLTTRKPPLLLDQDLLPRTELGRSAMTKFDGRGALLQVRLPCCLGMIRDYCACGAGRARFSLFPDGRGRVPLAHARRRSPCPAPCGPCNRHCGAAHPSAGRPAAAGHVLVRRFKTDQRGAGQEVAVRANPEERGFCPLAEFEIWLA